MTWLLRILPFLLGKKGRYVAAGAAVLGVAGLIWFQHERIQSYRTDLADARTALAAEISARQAAQDAVTEAVERAERLAAARDAAHARLTERLAAVDAAQGSCLDTELPAGLLD